MNKPVYSGISILKLSKILMYEFWYDYVKLRYGKQAKLGYMDADSFRCFTVYIKADDIYKDSAEDVETRFVTTNYELDRPLSKGKKYKVIGLMKDELGGEIMRKFVVLRVKTYSFSIDDGSEDKKTKDTKKRVIKRKLKLENYKTCLEATQLENKIHHLGKNKTDIDSSKKIMKNL